MGFLGDLLKGAAGGIPIAGPLISGLFSGLQGNAANNAEMADREAWNKYLQNYGGAQQQIREGLGDALWNPTSSSTGTSFGTSQTDSTTKFNNLMQKLAGSPQEQRMREKQASMLEGMMDRGPITEGERMRALGNANNVYEALARKQEVLGAGMGPVRRLGMSQGLDAERSKGLLDILSKLDPEGAEAQRRTSAMMGDQNAFQGLWQGNRQSGTSQTRGTTSSQGGSTMNQTRSADPSSLMSLFAPPAPNASMNTGFNPWLSAGADTWGALMQQMQQGENGQSPMTMPAPGSAPLMVPYGR